MFAKKKDKVNFHRILTMLIVFDNCLVLFNLVIFVLPHVNVYFRMKVYANIATIIIPMAQIAVTGSIYSTVAISIERYMISCHPFYVISHKWSAKRYVIPTIIFSILYNLPKFFELKTGKVYNAVSNSTEYILEGTNLRLNYEYFFFYTIWMNFVLMGLVPFVMITTLNGITVHQVIKQMRLITGSAKTIETHSVKNGVRVETSRAPFLAKRKRSQKIRRSQDIL